MFANIGLLVAELGVTPHHIVKFTTFVGGTGTLPGFRTGRDVVFGEWYPDGRTPGHTLAVVAALAGPGPLVETEVAVPERSAD